MTVALSLLTFSSTGVSGEDVSSPKPAEDWLQWRGPSRDGLIHGQAWPDRLKERLNLKWEKKLSPSYSGPLIHEDQVLTTETVDKQYEKVTAFAVNDGSQRWTAQWEGSMAVPFFAAANGDWIRSTSWMIIMANFGKRQ